MSPPLTTRVLAVALLALLGGARARAEEWYISYERGLEAIQNQRWQEAVVHLNDAIGEKRDSRARAKTYGLRFIDYFPYVYRGVAYYNLGNAVKAQEDLDRENGFGEVSKASNDRDAERLLRETLDKLRSAPVTDKVFAEGVRLYRQKDYDGAIREFRKIQPGAANYDDAQNYITMAERDRRPAERATATGQPPADAKPVARTTEDFNAGVRFFNRKEYGRAQEKFNAVLSADPANASARDYLDRIASLQKPAGEASRPVTEQRPAGTPSGPGPGVQQAAEARDVVLVRQGAEFFSAGKLRQAKEAFLSARAANAANADAQRYLAEIGKSEDTVRRGIAAYFEGRYDQSIETLGEAARTNVENPHIHGFLACAYAARYLLAGGDDSALADRAREHYRTARQLQASFDLDRRYISPGIIATLTSR